MKKHKNVQEWLDSKPAKEDLERVMNTINRGVLREIRKEISEKTPEVKFPVEDSVLNRIQETETEIEELRKELPDSMK
jgi:hypothetical protein